jgi:hypothetical protein
VGEEMRRIIFFLTLFIFLSGCSEIRYAKAREIRAETRRQNEIHALKMEEKRAELAERQALKEVRIVVKQNLIQTGMIAGIVLIVVVTGSVSYYIAGSSVAKVKQANIMQIPLDRVTRQYPLLIKGGNQAYNPNSLSNSSLVKIQGPHSEALEFSYKVQGIGAGPLYEKYKDYEEVQNQKLLLGKGS